MVRATARQEGQAPIEGRNATVGPRLMDGEVEIGEESAVFMGKIIDLIKMSMGYSRKDCG